MTVATPTLVLASASPRRAELLRRVGYTFGVRAADVDESVRAGEDPAAYVTRLAATKADAVWTPGTVVVGADTCVVAPDGGILGKPHDAADAARMLRSLSNQTHSVLTAVQVLGPERTARDVLATAMVTFAPLTEEEVTAYVAGGEPMGKAGAYAIQGQGAALVRSIDGDPTTVIGLPLRATIDALRAVGRTPPVFDPSSTRDPGFS